MQTTDTQQNKIKKFFSDAKWFWDGMTGADKYKKYLAHHQASGCKAPPMTEKEFWRDVTDRQDKNPQGRCC